MRYARQLRREDPPERAQAQARLRQLMAAAGQHRPFFAAYLERLRARIDEATPTMAVTLDERRRPLLLANPHFLAATDDGPLVAVLLHEVMHLLGGHVHEPRGLFSDEDALIASTEATANEPIATERFPTPPLLPDDLLLPPGEDFITRYARLVVGARGARLVRHAQHACATAHGHDPGERRESTGQRGRARLPWTTLVEHHAALPPDESDYGRPARRHQRLTGVVPGRRQRRARNVYAVLDTSASISPDALRRIVDELTAVARQHRVTVAEIDTDLRRLRRVRGRQDLAEVVGRGGTDLRPALTPRLLARLQPDLCLIVTDGATEMPERRPRCPVLFCLVEGGKKPVPWGIEIQLPVRGAA